MTELTVTGAYQKQGNEWKLLALTFSSVRDNHQIENSSTNDGDLRPHRSNEAEREADVRVAMAAEYGSPVIFLSGDQAADDELLAIAPIQPLHSQSRPSRATRCDTLSAAAARDLIRAKAKASMALIGQVREFTTRNSLTTDAPRVPNVTVLDDRTLQYRVATVEDAWR